MATKPTKKSYWQKPENYTSLLFIAAIVALGVYSLDSILPVVNRVLDYALETTFKSIALVAVLGLAWVLVASNDLHKLVGLGYMMVMRKLTEIFVNLDPIKIMEGIRSQFQKELDESASALGDLRGQEADITKTVKDTAAEIEQEKRLAVQAHKMSEKNQNRHMQQAFAASSNQVERLEEAQKTYKDLLKQVQTHVAIIERMQEKATFMVGDIGKTIKIERKKRDMINSTVRASRAARRIMAANDMRELYDMALEATTQQYFQKLGEMQQFVHDTKDLIISGTLQSGVNVEHATAKIKEWEARSENFDRLRVEDDEVIEQESQAQKTEIHKQMDAGNFDLFK